jgi:hypothetical protein
MSERQKEARFLKNLILNEDCDQGRDLQERLKSAERNERCIRCAVYWVLVVALLSIAGLGYCAVLVPEIGHFSSHLATRVCCALGLGSVLCLFVFLGYWFWYRALSNRVAEECRRFLRSTLERRRKHTTPPFPPSASSPAAVLSNNQTRQPQEGTAFLRLSKVA